jgi:hypothetical protein
MSSSENFRETPLNQKARFKKIVQGLNAGKTYGKIAEECGVSERTIYTDRHTLGFQDFVIDIFDTQLYDIAGLRKLGDKTAMFLRDRLLAKLLPQKIEQKTEGETSIIIKMWKPDADPDSDQVSTS